jgi:hypothetical protein
MNDCDQDFDQCFFRRQPQSPEEVEQAIQAIYASDVGALRYGGTDQTIIRRLHELGCADLCDHELMDPPVEPVTKSWWRRLFGGTG